MAYPGFRHIGLKLLSIVLASLIWLVVSGEQIVERDPDLEADRDVGDILDAAALRKPTKLSAGATGEQAEPQAPAAD